MIHSELHTQPVALDTVAHRGLRIQKQFSAIERIAKFPSFMITLSEFGEAAHDFPVLFVRADNDAEGKPQVASVAVFGLSQGENLFVDGDEWRADYLPAVLRAYPFTMARIENSDRHALVYDASWKGFSKTAGDPLFNAYGEATPLLKDVYKFVQDIEVDIERTRLAGQRLLELNLLQDMRFDATLPNGEKFSVDGFLGVDEKRLQELSDAEVGELHRNGLLGLLHIHRLSLTNMRRLLAKREERAAGGAKPAENAEAVPAPAPPKV